MSVYDTVIVGGGLVGMAGAYGLSKRGVNAVVLDEGDVAHRAARGNFALVWVHGKGAGFSRYASWTRTSSDLWPEFAKELGERADLDIAYSRRGGIHICFSDEEMEKRREHLELVAAEAESSDINPGVEYEMLDRLVLDKLIPGLGPDVVGASFSALDGHCNSLKLHQALLKNFQNLGGKYLPDSCVFEINPNGKGFFLRGVHSCL